MIGRLPIRPAEEDLGAFILLTTATGGFGRCWHSVITVTNTGQINLIRNVCEWAAAC